MNIFIAGGGRVGHHLARLLNVENHDITLIDTDPSKIEQIDYELDVSTLVGNAASVMLLKKAGVQEADLFVSSTGFDEVNLIAAAAAKGLGVNQVAARLDNAIYFDEAILYETLLGIDYVLSPEALAALEIANYIETSGIVSSASFGHGLVQMRQVRVTHSPTARGKTVRDVFPPGKGVLLGIINRDNNTIIPHGDTTVEQGDLVTLIGRSELMNSVQKRLQHFEPKGQRIVIAGGGSIGLHLAQALESQHRSVKLLENRLNRCNELAAILQKAKVVCRDATSRRDLDEENVEEADIFVGSTHDDERNIMACVLAKEMGAKQAVTVVHQPDFAPLVGKLGINHAVTPRACLASRILKIVHQEDVTSLAVLEEGQVEIVEFAVSKETAVTGKKLRTLKSKLPKDVLVATILRGSEVIVPSGEDEIRVGDSVVLIVDADSLESIQKLFLR